LPQETHQLGVQACSTFQGQNSLSQDFLDLRLLSEAGGPKYFLPAILGHQPGPDAGYRDFRLCDEAGGPYSDQAALACVRNCPKPTMLQCTTARAGNVSCVTITTLTLVRPALNVTSSIGLTSTIANHAAEGLT